MTGAATVRSLRMVTAYVAEDLKHKRKVALEVLKPQLAAALGAERFLAEIKTHGERRSCRA